MGWGSWLEYPQKQETSPAQGYQAPQTCCEDGEGQGEEKTRWSRLSSPLREGTVVSLWLEKLRLQRKEEEKTTGDKDLAKVWAKIKYIKFLQTQSCLFEFFHRADDIFITKGRSVEVELGPVGINRVALNTKEQA